MPARVFGDGDVTIAVNAGEASLWVGQRRIGMFSELSVRASVDGPPGVQIEIRFQRSHDPAVDKELEENARAAAAFPWIRVVR